MSDRFYLLRNNRETGPFTLDELLQQCLLAGDLVWVEGKSQNWEYPSEVPVVREALPKGYSLSPVAPTEPAPAGPQHASDKELALRAEQLRRRALAALYQQHPEPFQAESRPNGLSSAPVYVRDEDAVELVVHRPDKRGAIAELFLFGTMGALAVLGWRSGLFANLVQRSPEVSTVATRLVNEDQRAAAAIPVEQKASLLAPLAAGTAAAAADSSARTDSATLSDSAAAAAANYLARTPRSAPRRQVVAPRTDSPLVDAPDVATVPAAGSNNSNPEPAKKEAEPKKETVRSNVAEPEKKEVENNTAAAEPKKPEMATAEPEKARTGLGKVFQGLFGKKKKDKRADSTARD
ncbi:hypothetical protein [Flaviaesturariibacter amylovorans]|uniref:DUF4339 domain-containing protein n=1 Tax=Flaviaesturariibacter amylovorans TaxID=1084520 RepID=A0ABP8HVM4_9BACT